MNNSQTLLWSMLSEQSTEQLDERLAQELHRETVDEDAVRTILAVLRDREKDERVEVTPEIRQAWEKYQVDSKAIQGSKAKGRKVPGWGMRAASIGIVLLLLFAAIPQQAQAENFWEKLVRWTDSVFELFTPHAREAVQEEYVFQTKNPGLQQMYNKVVGMGISEPVVPMWLPDGYELVNYEQKTIPFSEYISYVFCDGSNEIILDVNIYSSTEAIQYQKDKSEVDLFEYQGTEFYIFHNLGERTVTWTKDNIVCCFTLDCQEDVFYKILKSIYGMEEKA